MTFWGDFFSTLITHLTFFFFISHSISNLSLFFLIIWKPEQKIVDLINLRKYIFFSHKTKPFFLLIFSHSYLTHNTFSKLKMVSISLEKSFFAHENKQKLIFFSSISWGKNYSLLKKRFFLNFMVQNQNVLFFYSVSQMKNPGQLKFHLVFQFSHIFFFFCKSISYMKKIISSGFFLDAFIN